MDSVGCLWLLMLGGFCFVNLLRLVQCGGSEAASMLLLGQCQCDMGMLLGLWASAGCLCFLCLQMFYHQILCGDGMDCLLVMV